MRTIKTLEFFLKNTKTGQEQWIAEVGKDWNHNCYTYNLEDFFQSIKDDEEASNVILVLRPSSVEVED